MTHSFGQAVRERRLELGMTAALLLGACDLGPPEIAEKYDVMTHPFYGEVSYGWRYDADRCVMYVKTGKKVTVLCRDLSK